MTHTMVVAAFAVCHGVFDDGKRGRRRRAENGRRNLGLGRPLVESLDLYNNGVVNEVHQLGTRDLKAGLHSEALSMRCPFCGVDNDRVTDSRTNQDGYAIRRRRQCLDCKRRFTTYERIEQVDVKVVKKDGVRDPFDSDKLRQGLAKACWKRPVSDDQIANIVSEIEREIFTSFDAEVDSSLLGEMIMQRLRQIDQVAFVRFASVYREFQDVRDFVDELQPMLKETQRPPS